MRSILLIFLLLASRLVAFEALCVGIHDGDSLTILKDKKEVKIRLEGIDAPELGQEYGTKSRQYLASLVFKKTVEIVPTTLDRFGRQVAWVKVAGASVNHSMIQSGNAWQFLKYNKNEDLRKLQSEAVASKRGLWSGFNPMSPWEYRSLAKKPAVNQLVAVAAAKDAKKEETAKGEKYWINSNGVRHNSSCRWYGKTKNGKWGAKSDGRACEKCGG